MPTQQITILCAVHMAQARSADRQCKYAEENIRSTRAAALTFTSEHDVDEFEIVSGFTQCKHAALHSSDSNNLRGTRSADTVSFGFCLPRSLPLNYVFHTKTYNLHACRQSRSHAHSHSTFIRCPCSSGLNASLAQRLRVPLWCIFDDAAPTKCMNWWHCHCINKSLGR